MVGILVSLGISLGLLLLACLTPGGDLHHRKEKVNDPQDS